VYRYFGGKVDWLAAGLPAEGKLTSEPRIGSLARREIVTCRVGQKVGELQMDGDLCVVVNEAGVVLGDLRGKALHEKPNARVEDVMNPAPSTYRPNVSVHEMAHEFSNSKATRVLVSDGDGRLLGWLSREDVEKALSEQSAHGDGPVLASSH
jgi:Mg/Co/Ni transporter MgtE